MKSKITVLILILFATATFAQEYNDSTYFYDGLVFTWELESREYVLERNNQGNVLSAIHHAYDENTDSWSDKYRITYTYYADGVSVNTYLKEVWNPALTEWVEIKYKEYNSDGESIEFFYKNWDFETNQLINGHRTIENRSGDQIINIYRDTLNPISDTWEYEFYEEYSYDTDELLTEKMTYKYEGSWNYYERSNYFYHNGDLVTQIFVYRWLDATGDWLDYMYYIFNYNDDGYPIEEVTQTKQGSSWMKTVKYDKVYNGNNEMITNTISLGNESTNTWEEYMRFNYYYNTNGTINYEILETYDADWVYYQGTWYEYDYNDNLTAKRIKDWYSNTWNDDIEYIYEYDDNKKTLEYKRHKISSGFWISDYKNEYFWFEPPTANAGNNDEVECILEYTLNANEPETGQTGTWSITGSGSGSFDDIHSPTATFTAAENGNYVLTWTVSNGITEDSDNVEINFPEDTEDPTITCVDNQTINLSQGQTFYTVQETEFDPTATDDNCEVASVMNDFNSTETLAGAELPEGTTTIVWTVTDASGNTTDCTFDVTVNAFVGIADLSANGISIYPNPTSGIINLTGFKEPVSVKNIKITDITGKTLQSFSGSQIDISYLQNGIYVLEIETEKGVYTKKIIKR